MFSNNQNESLNRIINNYPERDINKYEKKVTSNNNLNTVSNGGRKITVFGDSIVKRIRTKEFNKHINTGYAFIKSFPGANAQEINHYVIPTLMNESPDVVIIHAGSNNLHTRRGKAEQTIDSIVQDILQIGRTCRQSGVKDISISSITYRSNANEMKKVREINNILKSLCVTENFIFICNDSIGKEHLWKDGLHLLDGGTEILGNNFIKSLNENLL